MINQTHFSVKIDEHGQAIFPPEISEAFGLDPGTQMIVDKQSTGLYIHRPTSHLVKIYIEPTNRCNLKCLTCIRNAWDESAGWMSDIAFNNIISGLSESNEKDCFGNNFPTCGGCLWAQGLIQRP